METATANENESATETETERGIEAVIAIETGTGIGIVTEIIGMVDVTMRFPGKGITTVMTTMIRAANGDTKHTLFSFSTMVCWWVSSVVRFLLHPVSSRVRSAALTEYGHVVSNITILGFCAEIYSISNTTLHPSLGHRLPEASSDFVPCVVKSSTT